MPAGAAPIQLSGERRFQLLVDSIHDYAIYMLDPQGYVVSWNPGAQRLKGYSPDEIIGEHFSHFFPAEDRRDGLPQRMLAKAFKEGRYQTEGWRVRKDGSRFRASVVVDTIRDENGAHLGFAKITRDITERFEAEAALRLSEERFRLLVQGVIDYSIYLLDTDGRVTNWNAGAERMKGYTADEIVGQHFSRFYPEEDRAAGAPAHSLDTARREGRYETEGWRVRKDGTRFYASVVIDAIRNESGDLIGFAKITRDITEQRRTREALEEARIALFQSQKMEALGQLTGGIAHDFNNLLTVIVNSLDLLRRRAKDARDLRLVDNAHRAAERGARLTQQLLAFARRQALTPASHDVNTLIRGFEPILRRACGEAVALRVDLVHRPTPVEIDAPQFEAALLNLVVNARDAMPDGGRLTVASGLLEVDAERAEGWGVKPGHFVAVHVTDSGTGIAPEIVERVLEPFFTTKEMGRGTGLGLSQVYGFVRQSNGQMEIASTVGQGTTVSLYLPLGEGVVNADDAPEHGAAFGGYGTVLVVEDEPEVLEIAVELFHALGYSVLTATDGAAALDVLKRPDSIDVLFTDVVMPAGINGLDLAREACRLRPRLQVILASGYPIPATSPQLAGLANAAFITKPYRWSELAERLKSLRAGGNALE
ncbi:PAS domain S-box protein [Azospirillum sp. RWY-5-1]|uniref:histidine kinase n=1 Tax=Azospirillum oleiclasticum TaxID=2735135 RepID=A0ABX2T8B0_9PROT|nr:PAS domain S-box protein [Azospirillum oleiclasticum]NYZ19477.1 PAS domain S-box protein [Azospirillum oleiclasticum]